MEQEKGEFLPQKWDLKSSVETQYISVQRHVSSYYVKRSPGCFVWAAPTLLTAGPLHNMALNSLRGANAVEDSNPARVKAR
jgi:hypothetical protein